MSDFKLWIDDHINDPETPDRHPAEGFIGADTIRSAIQAVILNGFPTFLQLDHDLGVDETGKEIKVMQFLQWLFEAYPNNKPPQYNIHSKNPCGIENIDAFMKSWMKAYYL